MSEKSFNILYSSYSHRLIYNYFSMFFMHEVYSDITKEYKDKIPKKIIKNFKTLSSFVLKNNLFNDFIYFTLSNIKDKELLIPSSINDDNFKLLKKSIEKNIELFSKKTKKELNSNNIIKNILNKIKIKKILPFIKNHNLPPLISKNSYKKYTIKNKKYSYKNTKGEFFYLYRKNDISLKLNIDQVLFGSIFNYYDPKEEKLEIVNEEITVIKFRYFLNNRHIKKLKENFSGKDFNNSVFQLLSCYYFNELLVNEYNIPEIFLSLEIENKKLKNLYDLSTELVGTPLCNHKPYYGLYPNIEKEFGSLGSCYDFKPDSNSNKIQYYSVKSRVSYYFIKYMYEKIKYFLKNYKISFLFWIPTFYIVLDTYLINTKDILLNKVYEEIVPEIKKSKYLKNKFYYKFYKKKENKSNFIVFHLQS